MRSDGSIAWPNSIVWCVDAWVITERQQKFITFVPVKVGEDQATITQSRYVQNITAEQLAFRASAQGDLFATIDSPSKTYSTKCMNC